jgi:hypothetical protein
MKKKNKPEKICLCGRIITDPKNKTGLCPKCQKAGVDIGGALGLAGIGILLKKNGGKIIKGAFNVVKSIKKF